MFYENLLLVYGAFHAYDKENIYTKACNNYVVNTLSKLLNSDVETCKLELQKLSFLYVFPTMFSVVLIQSIFNYSNNLTSVVCVFVSGFIVNISHKNWQNTSKKVLNICVYLIIIWVVLHILFSNIYNPITNTWNLGLVLNASKNAENVNMGIGIIAIILLVSWGCISLLYLLSNYIVRLVKIFARHCLSQKNPTGVMFLFFSLDVFGWLL